MQNKELDESSTIEYRIIKSINLLCGREVKSDDFKIYNIERDNQSLLYCSEEDANKGTLRFYCHKEGEQTESKISLLTSTSTISVYNEYVEISKADCSGCTAYNAGDYFNWCIENQTQFTWEFLDELRQLVKDIDAMSIKFYIEDLSE